MNRFAFVTSLFVAAALLPGCDDVLGTGGDGGTADMTPAPFRLKAGVYKVTNLTNKDDKCMVDTAMNPVLNSLRAIQNDGGVVKFGSLDKVNTMMPAAETGMPPQPTLGISCADKNTAPCSSEPGWMPYGNNTLWVVRDNSVTVDMNCSFHRHAVNVIKLTADGVFTSQFSLEDSAPSMGCAMGTVNVCKTTWTWDLAWQNDFK